MSAWLAERPGHGAVRVAGPDATSFLQSLVSQDLEGLEDADGARALLLTPQGKLDVVLRMLCVGSGGPTREWWLDCDAGFGARLAEALGRYRIRVDVEIEDRSGSWSLLEVRGHDAVARVAGATKVEIPDAQHGHVEWASGRVVRADWADRPGVDITGPIDAVHTVRDELLRAGVRPVAPGEYETARIEAGVIRLGTDVDERTIPQEAFLERDAVSFTKGCFLGQELVCRIDTRGHVNRFLRLLRMSEPVAPEPGAEVLSSGAPVGGLTSVAPASDGSGAVALAMIRREIEPPASVDVRAGAREVSATVEVLPGSGS